MSDPVTVVDTRLIVSGISAAVAIGLWVAKEFIQAWLRREDGKKRRDNLVRALYAEVDFNTRDMEIFLSKSPSKDTLKDTMTANPSLVPHITDARHTEIYRSKIAELHGVKDRTLSNMVHFYGMLEKIKMQIEGVNYPSYKTLSVDGRMNGVMVIVRTAHVARRLGQDLLSDMEQDYPKLALTRFDRGPEPDLDTEQEEAADPSPAFDTKKPA
ncbi:MAG: hypothetical protein AAGL96_00220 [Pseudomonadota bacterium]